MGCWAWYVDLSIKAITALLYGWSEVITSGSFGMSTRRRYHAEVLRDGREEPERQSQNSIAVLLSCWRVPAKPKRNKGGLGQLYIGYQGFPKTGRSDNLLQCRRSGRKARHRQLCLYTYAGGLIHGAACNPCCSGDPEPCTPFSSCNLDLRCNN